MPDIMLLPKIADVLGVTLNDLYGIENKHNDRKVKVDEFPAAAQHMLINFFYEQTGCHHPPFVNFVKAEKNPDTDCFEHIENGRTFGVISDIAGVAFISDKLSIIDSDYKILNNGSIFENKGIASGLKKLSDAGVRKVLRYMYAQSFKDISTHNKDLFDKEFLLCEISLGCNLTEDDGLEAIEKLISMHIIEISVENHITKYIFKKTKAIETAITFKVVERLIGELLRWGCGSLINNGIE